MYLWFNSNPCQRWNVLCLLPVREKDNCVLHTWVPLKFVWVCWNSLVILGSMKPVLLFYTFILITITTEWICMNVSRMIKLSFKLLKLSFYHSHVCLYACVCAKRGNTMQMFHLYISLSDKDLKRFNGLSTWF